MVGGCTPVSVRCSWNARSSSGVAVSGERPRKVASLLTARMYSRCVSGTNLRMLMSSSMRWRSGLMGFSLIGGSCLEVGVLDPSILKTERPLRHLRSINVVTGLKPHGFTPEQQSPAVAGSFCDDKRRLVRIDREVRVARHHPIGDDMH